MYEYFLQLHSCALYYTLFFFYDYYYNTIQRLQRTYTVYQHFNRVLHTYMNSSTQVKIRSALSSLLTPCALYP